MKVKYKILIVDDNESIRFAMLDYLKKDFYVLSAENGIEALKILSQSHVDMIISDIRMPDMDGITLINQVKKQYPAIKYALITAYNINDYIRYAREYKIWNIIPKSSFLDMQFIKTMILKLLTNDIFGFDKYFKDVEYMNIKISDLYKFYKDENFFLENQKIYMISIQSEEQRFKVCDMIMEQFKKYQAPTIFRSLLEELTINARDYGSDNYQSPIKIQFGIYNNNFLFAVNDYRGTLNFEEVLYRLERNLTVDQNGLPLSIYDVHGRGFFIARENLDHLVINIKENIETEILGIYDRDNQFRNKAISLYKIK